MNKRTKQQALTHILAELDAGRLGARCVYGNCIYEDEEGNHCSVGCLFTTEQHQWIQTHGANESGIFGLMDAVGRHNLEYVTGMDIDVLVDIQVLHDMWATTYGDSDTYRRIFRDRLVNMIDKESTPK
jgi:hypothetical protein